MTLPRTSDDGGDPKDDSKGQDGPCWSRHSSMSFLQKPPKSPGGHSSLQQDLCAVFTPESFACNDFYFLATPTCLKYTMVPRAFEIDENMQKNLALGTWDSAPFCAQLSPASEKHLKTILSLFRIKREKPGKRELGRANHPLTRISCKLHPMSLFLSPGK